ncbi:MAG TPA: DUF1801 domain-containing protein [Steroidobacteraceae bacterium]
MSAIFRLSGASKRDPAIDEWLSKDDALTAIARRWFKAMRACGEDVLELLHDGCPTACIDDAPYAYVNVFKSHTNVGFFNGASLDDPAGLLEGSGKNMRHVKLKPGYESDTAALAHLIHAAYLDMKLRLRTE